MPSTELTKELHKEMLLLLKRFDELCTANDIKYSLHAGTLLGAVREKGFIPWDDDIDVTVTRDNSAGYICESIDSVLEQTYAEWELWVVDDGSTDNTAEVVKKFKDRRIHYVKQATNKGVAAARNLGIEKSQGRFLAFLDSDDIWLPEKLEKQLAFINRKKCGMSYTEYRQFVNHPDVAGKLIRTRDSVDYQVLLKGNDIGCLTVIIDRWQHPRIVMPPYRHEDLARYRKSYKSLSSNKWNSMRWTWNVYRKHQKLSVLKSGYYMAHYVVNGLRKHY